MTEFEKKLSECGFCLSIGRKWLTDEGLYNVKKMVAARSNLIQKAIGCSSTKVEFDDDCVYFPWFDEFPKDYDYRNAFITFIQYLCRYAKQAKVIRNLKPEPEERTNEKQDMRLFLLRLGMTGNDNAWIRAELLKRLQGDSAGTRKRLDKNAPLPETKIIEIKGDN